jgi:uncharacterized phage protein (TIGR01671 family)
MREIKFRAWDKTNKMWRQPGNAFEISVISGAVQQNYRDTSADVELMQYTGLKDKNGVEIYEGDILKLNDMVFTFEWVEKYSLGFYCGWKIKHISGYNGSPSMEDCEVIGNIHQNPELLKQEAF